MKKIHAIAIGALMAAGIGTSFGQGPPAGGGRGAGGGGRGPGGPGLALSTPDFEDGGVIDQPFQARLTDGVVRCYMAGDRCAGFGYQKVKALVDTPAGRAGAGPRLYTHNADSRFERLRRLNGLRSTRLRVGTLLKLR